MKDSAGWFETLTNHRCVACDLLPLRSNFREFGMITSRQAMIKLENIKFVEGKHAVYGA